MAKAAEKPSRNGPLKVDLPFDEALRAAMEVKPPEKPPRKPRAKKPSKG
jgi:hypothetical protein